MQLYYPVILDGATGTELQKRGFTGGGCAEAWVLEHPEAMLDIQRRYVDAGSGIIYTPTFGANRVKLEGAGIFNSVRDYNLRLAAISKEAAAGRALVAGTSHPRGCSSPLWALRALKSSWKYMPSRPPHSKRRASTSSSLRR